MPYIHKQRRQYAREIPLDAGELTYAIQQQLMKFLGPKPNYEAYAISLGVLEGAKADLIRRKLNPYEEGAQSRNGDVW